MENNSGGSHFKAILALVMAILVAIFAIMNSGEVEISFGFKTVNVSLAIIILIAVLVGAVFMYIITLTSAIKKRSSKRAVAKAEKMEAKQKIKDAKAQKAADKKEAKEAKANKKLEAKSEKTISSDNNSADDEELVFGSRKKAEPSNEANSNSVDSSKLEADDSAKDDSKGKINVIEG